VISLRTKIVAGVVLAIAVVVLAYCERRAGIQVGQVEQKIVASGERVKQLEAAVAAVDKETAVQVEKSTTKRTEYRAARAKVEVKGDSVIADGQRVDMPSVAAALIKGDAMGTQDSTAIREQARSDTLQHVLVGALDHHVDLLQEEKRPRFGTKTGIAIGVVGTVGVVYVAVRIIKAVAHK
jgi:hypothetical protein